MSIIDMHLHIKYRSRCSNLSVDDLAANLSPLFNAICITDHWRLKAMIYNPFEKTKVFFGAEISCNYGDILAYGVKSIPIRSKHIRAEDVIKMIHKQGGIAVCAHPYSNRHQGFGSKVFDFDFDALEINGALDQKFHSMAKSAAKIMDIPLIGGSDAHSIRQLNTVGTKFEKKICTMEDLVKAIKNKECEAVLI